MISSRDFHTGRILLFADILCQNSLIIHTHIIKNFKNFRIEMILVKVTAKDYGFLAFVKARHLAFVVIKNIIAVLGFNQKSTVVNVCYFHNPPLLLLSYYIKAINRNQYRTTFSIRSKKLETVCLILFAFLTKNSSNCRIKYINSKRLETKFVCMV